MKRWRLLGFSSDTILLLTPARPLQNYRRHLAQKSGFLIKSNAARERLQRSLVNSSKTLIELRKTSEPETSWAINIGSSSKICRTLSLVPNYGFMMSISDACSSQRHITRAWSRLAHERASLLSCVGERSSAAVRRPG